MTESEQHAQAMQRQRDAAREGRSDAEVALRICQSQRDALTALLGEFVTASVLAGVDGGHALKVARRKAVAMLAEVGG